MTDRPSLIKVTTVIGWPLPTMAGSEKVHGAKIGAEEIARLKERLGLDPTKSFDVAPEIVEYTRSNATARAAAYRATWDTKFDAWTQANPEGRALLDRVLANGTPDALARSPAAVPRR